MDKYLFSDIFFPYEMELRIPQINDEFITFQERNTEELFNWPVVYPKSKMKLNHKIPISTFRIELRVRKKNIGWHHLHSAYGNTDACIKIYLLYVSLHVTLNMLVVIIFIFFLYFCVFFFSFTPVPWAQKSGTCICVNIHISFFRMKITCQTVSVCSYL